MNKKLIFLIMILFLNNLFLIADEMNDVIELENVEEQNKVYKEQEINENLNTSEENETKEIETKVKVNADHIIKLAMKMKGKPYKYGGMTPEEGFDCSGLVCYVFGKNGINMNRTVEEQFKQGKEVELFEIQKGDLLFFQVYENSFYNLGVIKNFFTEYIKLYPNHIAIYIGDGNFIHSPKDGDVIKIDTLRKKFWKKHLFGIKRVL